jgi:tetratricopeptide (TPR) repeat protein
MKAKAPPDRRKFATTWDEIGYLYDKLLYWLYQRQEVERARPYAERLERLLPTADARHEAIRGEECWSLVYETKGDVHKAIKHRLNEIRLIRRLHRISRHAPNERVMLKAYGYDDLSDRLDLLAVLYHNSGDSESALRSLQESRQLCKQHGIKFDGDDILQEYLAERSNNQPPHAPRMPGPNHRRSRAGA